MTVTVGGKMFNTRLPSSNNRKDDALDIAVVQLDIAVASLLKNANYHFIHYQNVMTGIELEKNYHLLIAGFPASKTKFDLKKNAIEFNPLIVYSGETDHVIPWQTDQGFSWRTEVVNAVEGLSKLIV